MTPDDRPTPPTSLRSFPPSRFADGVAVQDVVDDIERTTDASIRIVGYDAIHDEDWTILVDGERAGTIGHTRRLEGYSEFAMTSDEFASLVASVIGAGPTELGEPGQEE